MSGTESTAASPEFALETRIVRMKLRDIELLAKEDNARFMQASEYRQLVENLRIDKRLTSVPLIYKGKCLSGNHRVEAAIDAGIEEADVMEIVGDIPPDRELAIQLSHNAIAGQDDLGILHSLYKKLDLSWKRFTGLTDETFAQLKPIDISALALGAPKYQELLLLFLPEEQTKVLEVLEKFKAKIAERGLIAHIAHLADFDNFFNAIVRVKKQKGVYNSALAFRVMADLAMAALDRETETAKLKEATP